MGQDVGECSHEYAEVPVERPYPPDGRGPVPVIAQPRIGLANARDGQERFQMGLDSDRARSGATPAVRCRKRLVQVEMHHVSAEVAGTSDAYQRIHVGAVYV